MDNLFCHPCLTDSEGGVEEPATTMRKGTALCTSCAQTVAQNVSGSGKTGIA